MSESTILAPLDSAELINCGLLGPGRTTGSQRLHKRRLNRSSDEENHDISLNISLSSPAADGAFAMIPVALISYETLVYVGLSEAKATELWNQWTSWPAQGPLRETDPDDGGWIVTFKDFIIGSFENRVDAADDNDQEWRACLNRCGVAVDVQNAIMDPRFKYLRLSQSCLYWVNDTVNMRYAGLEDIQRSSHEREMQLRRIATRPGDKQGGRQGGSDIATESSSSAGQGQHSVSGFQQQDTPGIGLDIWGSTSAIAARNAPGHTVLFKGLDQGRIAGLFDEAGTLDRISTLLSSAPSDLSGTRSLFYFTPDHHVAEYHAAYAKRRANCESIVIVCLRIPNAAIESLSASDVQCIYWPSNEWKELIWLCRTVKSLPLHLRKYRQAILVIGTVSRKPDSVYHAMNSWQQVTETCLFRVGPPGQKNLTIQYVFSGEEDGCQFLIENGARNMKIFPYPQSELEAWLAASSSSDY
ncbi:hypothetical protein DTO164E3_7842 [Paecilomyces variotii]|uniref:Uncharacterized protein n=1 Tax=Byssochlamys spectabilis TaxID=264951 RepID=A0A443HL55_BYSSP|nr:hypothetical protein C8Q69DRAFT_479569 [Paecilomyces variotii]KAJ9193586.1 hypothetical protein DTO164E3_7842 [Paecilomyces variotii]KAJ9234553.1 hypothetical protein DTO169E5_6504 [Paecilomyces variotii]KAJ9246557.1 hypothetical protein DTO207G8_8828 [Paecilomyces variotii]KAJ9264101.1 hypothetical protein DTO195F2_2628 [Paecilomyces variotii]KAJ9306634.1 hypothetical protein DTO217A2_3802 [Paecilomyces variotii]